MTINFTDDDLDTIVEALGAMADALEADGDECFERELEKINAVYAKIAAKSRMGEEE